MELQEFVRKPFPVKAVEVNFQNAYEVAEWCRGRVELKKTRLMGGAGKGEMDLPTVVFKGTGDNRDKEFTAGLGDWVVELRGNFRMFKKAQFRATFEPVPTKIEGAKIKAFEVDEIACNDNPDDQAEAVAGEPWVDNSSVDGQESVSVSL
jgi:hypothetical protein